MGARCGKDTNASSPADEAAADTPKTLQRPPGGSADEGRSQASAGPTELRARSRLGLRNLTSRALFIQHNEGRLQDSYDVGEKRGEGTQGVVFLATRRSDGVVRAVKKVYKMGMKQAAINCFKKEVDIMKSMDHPNIVRLYDTFEEREAFYIVMELCRGGELLDRIIASGQLTEYTAAVVIKQVLRAVFYMHEHNVVHRDLKPENFLLVDDRPISDDNLLKLIDFGIACECVPGQTLTELRGTPFYVAPQVVTKRYTEKCDLWSVGVIMYTLICGSVPFNGTDEKGILDKVRVGIVTYRDEDWSRVSPDAKDLVRKLLTRNQEQRVSAEDALNHKWVKQTAPQHQIHMPSDFLQRLDSFRKGNIIQKAALQIVAGELTDESIKLLREVFQSLDSNGDGKLTIDEITRGIADAGLHLPTNLRQILEGVDADGSGIVDYTEFLAATLERRTMLSEPVCRQAFMKFDNDGDGRIEVKEFCKALGGGHSGMGFANEVEQAISDFTGGEDTMDFDNFHKMMMTSGILGSTRSPPAQTPVMTVDRVVSIKACASKGQITDYGFENAESPNGSSLGFGEPGSPSSGHGHQVTTSVASPGHGLIDNPGGYPISPSGGSLGQGLPISPSGSSPGHHV